MNVRLLQKVKAHILEEPNRFQMGYWIKKGDPGTEVFIDYRVDGRRTRRLPACGTAACLAGWAVQLIDPTITSDIELKAERLLGLSRQQSFKLFRVNQWSKHFQKLWHATRSPRKHAQIAARVIDQFIKTGK